jgi:hypothetical protein
VQGYHFPPPEPEPAYGYAPQPLGAQPQWGQPADPNGGYELSYQGYDNNDPPPFHNHNQHQQQGYSDQDGDYGGDEYFEDDEPRSGRRWMWIAAAVVGAIGVGGVLAYTYKSLVAPGPGRVPVAKVESAPKARPDFRGAAAERKLPTRPAEEASPASDEPAADTAAVGPRVVRPIPILPGGSPSASEPPPPPAPSSSVPGITLYQPPAPPQAAPPAAPPALATPQPPVRPALPPQAAPQAPARVTIGSRPPAADTEDEPPAVARRPSPPPAAQAPRPAPPSPPPAPTRTASSGLGYVAVLKSSKTSMDALQTFADMQQQYPDVLNGKTPDVQTADLSSRGLGTMYRLVVGPPGSQNAARSVCNQLKTAGYEGCWVKEY